MNLSNLRKLCRLSVPAAKKSRITTPSLDLIINEVVKDINARLKLLNQDEKFNVVADQYRYDLSDSEETVTRFSKIDNLGLYWNAGSATSPDWKRLYSKTVKWLDKNFPQWRDADSSNPMYYAKKGRYLYICPTPDTALSSGFWLYYIQNPVPMSSNSSYPFGGTVEISEYSILTDAIIAGVRATILPMIGKPEQRQQAFTEYLNIIELKRRVLREILDITSTKEARIKIPHIC